MNTINTQPGPINFQNKHLTDLYRSSRNKIKVTYLRLITIVYTI